MAGDEIQFRLADPSHDSGIRNLLANCPMPGAISLTLHREPSYFAAAGIEGDEHHAMIALCRGEVVAMGSVSVRERFFNGKPIRMGYLGGLRIHPCWQGRFDILRRGYQFLRTIHRTLNVSFYLTSIAADNSRAIQVLERGLPGMPIYRHVGDLGTALFRAQRRLRRNLGRDSIEVREGHPDMREAIAEHLVEAMSQFQFAPRWTAGEIRRHIENHGLRDDNFRLLIDRGRICACAALWDQRSLKQVVVSKYSREMKLARPFYNLYAAMTGRVPLPPPKAAISQAFISHLSVPADSPQLLEQLIDSLSAAAHTRGIKMLAVGLDARDPRLKWIQDHMCPRVYHTRLYLVRWPDEPSPFGPPDDRLMYPEIALL